MANPATVWDLDEFFYRPLTARERDIGQRWLDAAYRKLLGRRPQLEASVTAGDVSVAAVIDVVCAMVARVFSNPEGIESEQIDDYKYARSSTVRDGLLYVTDDELADVTPAPAPGSRRSIRLVIYGDP